MVSSSTRSAREALTDRERDILGLLNEGLSDREIAAKRVLTLGTVKWYNHQIYEKLGVRSRTQAINRARDLGLLHLQPKSPKASPSNHNLPAETTRFIGRKREVDEIKALLRASRLLTLTGSPGTGKTRLSLRVAAEVLPDFADGVYFVNLAPIHSPAYVAVTIADALGIEERTTETLSETLRRTLRDQKLLLILDNFEHVLPAIGLVSELLAAVPGLKILVTSREVLRVYGEQEYNVPSLELPDVDSGDLAAMSQCEAVALFVQQARAVKPDFVLTDQNIVDVASVCVRLDGLPLAIELAAAHSKLLSPQALLARLNHPFDTLIGGSRDLPARQQTLRQTIDWSYSLLAEGQKMLFARLGIFSGGWTLEAMQEVCSGNLPLGLFESLEALVNKSLVRQQEIQGTPRFVMLETIRDYALEQLAASGEIDALRRRHARYYTALAELVERGLQGMKERSALDNLELEHDNFRAVLNWSLTSDPEPGLRLIAALGQCWRIRGHLLEGWRWSQSLLGMDGCSNSAVRARALSSASMLAFHLGHDPQSEQMSREAVSLARQTDQPEVLAWSSYALGLALIRPHMTEDDYRESEAHLDAALSMFRSQGHPLGIAKSLTARGELFRLKGALERAAQCYDEAIALFSQLGNAVGMSVNLSNLAWVSERLGDGKRAEELFRKSLTLSEQIQHRGTALSAVAGLAALAVNAHQLDRAALLFGAIEAQRRAYGDGLCAADRADYEPFIVTARNQMEPLTYERLVEQGSTLTLERAIAFAVGQAQPG